MVMHAASMERRRQLARVLHEPRDARYAMLHVSILRYRERAAAIWVKLIDLDYAGNDNVAQLRRALLACSEQVESIARIVGVPITMMPPAQEWLEMPTLPRRIKAR